MLSVRQLSGFYGNELKYEVTDPKTSNTVRVFAIK